MAQLKMKFKKNLNKYPNIISTIEIKRRSQLNKRIYFIIQSLFILLLFIINLIQIIKILIKLNIIFPM